MVKYLKRYYRIMLAFCIAFMQAVKERPRKIGRFEGVLVIKSDVTILHHLHLRADQAGCAASMYGYFGKKKEPCIIVNSGFIALTDEDARLAWMYHELGHIVLGHLELPQITVSQRMLDLEHLIRLEYDADQYSYLRGGKMLETLEAALISGVYMKPELELRIANIKGYMGVDQV